MKDIKYFEDLVHEIISIAAEWRGYENSPDEKIAIAAKRHIKQAANILRESFYKDKTEEQDA